jgi:hypothetical protein
MMPSATHMTEDSTGSGRPSMNGGNANEMVKEEEELVWTRQHRVYHLIAAFSHSIAKRQAHHRREIFLSHAGFVRDILDDIIFDAIERGRRSDFFNMRKTVMIANAAALFDSYGFTNASANSNIYNDPSRTIGRSTSNDYAGNGGGSSGNGGTSGKISRFLKNTHRRRN